ncbi:MAG: hypothetical protein JO041_03360 [Acidobacteria bacterium]|nr:hypothetical protein [Acidobacteriota bacterium]
MELDDRIREVSDELCSIQKELNRMLMRTISEGLGSPAHDYASSLSALGDFKLVVDQLRQFLWFYMQVVNGSEMTEETTRVMRRAALDPRTDGDTHAINFLRQMNGSSEYALVHVGPGRGRKPN